MRPAQCCSSGYTAAFGSKVPGHFLENKKGQGGGTMKTLYVADLDGTLLRSDETISSYTNRIINKIGRAHV